MKTTRYFDEQVLRKRPYIERDWRAAVLATPVKRVGQSDGRWRLWGYVVRPGEVTPRALRVIVLADGETIHNAFFDRDFREDDP